MFHKKIVSAVCVAAWLLAASGLWAPRALAQSPCYAYNDNIEITYYSFCGEQVGATTGAVASSYGDAVTGLQNQVLNTTVFGLAAAQASGGGVEVGVFPTGRLRQTYHDGYKSVGGGPGVDLPSFSTSEGSAFGTLFLKLPSGAGGGQLQLGGFAGYDELFMKISANPLNDTFYASKARNESFLYGGYGLYTLGSSYLMLTLSGAEGTTKLSSQDPDSAESSYGVHGFIGSFTGGHIVALSPQTAKMPLKLDVRAGVNYINMEGGEFLSPLTPPSQSPYRPLNTYSTSLENWNGSLVLTLFSQIPSESGGIWRPFVKGEFRQQLYYDNSVREVSTIFSNANTDTDVYNYKFSQNGSAGGLEVGLDYVLPGVTFNAAAFGELSGDRESFGGRIGAKFTFR